MNCYEIKFNIYKLFIVFIYSYSLILKSLFTLFYLLFSPVDYDLLYKKQTIKLNESRVNKIY